MNNVDDFNHVSLTELCSVSLLRPKYHTVSPEYGTPSVTKVLKN